MAISRVQTQSGNTVASTVLTSLALVLGAAPTAGNTVILAVDTNGTLPSIDPTAGINWYQLFKPGTSSVDLAIFVGRVFASASATITVNSLNIAGAATASGISAIAIEYSGLGPLDRSASNTGTSTSPSTGATQSTTSAVELFFGALAHRGAATYSSPSSGFSIVTQTATSIGSTGDRSLVVLEQISSAAGTPNASATASTNAVWAGIMATFEPVASAGGLLRQAGMNAGIGG